MNKEHDFGRCSQAGFSLIELMVASAIGLMIMAAILTLYLNVTRTNDEMAKTNMMVENGRFAIQLLQDDLSHAGFWDSYIPEHEDLAFADEPDVPTEVRNPCSNYSSSWDLISRMGIPVVVYSSVSVMPTGCSSLLPGYKSGTDVLVVRRANNCVSGDSGCENVVDGKLYLQVSRARGGDCAGTIPTESPYVLSRTVSSFVLHEADCTVSTRKRRFISHIYYVRDYAVSAGDGIPTLMRSEFDLDSGVVKARSPEPLVEGVEGFRVELGVDRVGDNGTDIIDDADEGNRYTEELAWIDEDEKANPRNRGDGAPDEFAHCSGVCSVEELSNVVAVKLHLLVRSTISTPGYVDGKSYVLGDQTITPASDGDDDNDGFKRHVFSTVVRLNNVSARRETP